MNRIFRKGLIVSFLVLLSSCGTSPKANFYLLSSTHEAQTEAADKLSIGVWQVKLPELIDRPEMVTRTGPYTIELADFHRWAGGLGSNISLLIANELSYNLKTGHVDISPWSSYRDFDYQVKVHIRKFDGEFDVGSTLQGAFVILNGKGNKKLFEESFAFNEKVKSKNYSDMAGAMSKLVIKLSEQISKAIQNKTK